MKESVRTGNLSSDAFCIFIGFTVCVDSFMPSGAISVIFWINLSCAESASIAKHAFHNLLSQDHRAAVLKRDL